jgi:Sulfocyanin (SoxE) domain
MTVHCRNAGSLRNSCTVVQGALSATLAFPGASTPDPVTGLAGGQSASFSFTPTRVGVFRLVSVVPGHAEARMWDVLVVTRTGRPSISARPGA